jgi:hypothetical protein
LGAFGFLLLGQEKPGTWQRHRLAAMVGVMCVAVSIFFGCVACLFIQSMLLDGPLDLTSLSPRRVGSLPIRL